MTRYRRIAVLVAAAGAALAAALPATSATEATPSLVATIGTASNADAFEVHLKLNGKEVTKLKPGIYRIAVSDQSAIHNWELLKGSKPSRTGPFVQLVNPTTKKPITGKFARTSVGGKSKTTFTVRLTKGTYVYQCNPHIPSMAATFTVA
jgi:plastocyanin